LTQDLNVPTAHSEFGPSGSPRWMACPASIGMIRSLNLPRTSNKYADYGSCAHELGAMMLIDPMVTAESQLGKKLYGDVKVDDEMVKGVNEYVDYVMSYQTLTSKLLVETRVSLEHLQPGTFGTADVIITDECIVHVMDLKFGKGIPVEVENNSQLQLYAIGSLLELAKRGKNLKNIKKVVLHIVQPRCPHSDGPFRSWDTTVDELKNVSKRAKEAIINACSINPTFNPGEKQCQWCEASGMCRPLAEYNMKMASNDFQEFGSSIEEKDFIDINVLSKQEISLLLSHVNIMQAWLNSLLGSASDSLRRGEVIPDYKLVRGRSIRKWDTMEEKVLVKKLTQDNPNLMLGLEDVYTKKIKSPTQIEKLITKEEYKEIIAPMVVKPEGKIVMAHASDKRKAVSPDMEAANEFSEFAE